MFYPFQKENVVRYHKEEEFKQINQDDLIDIVHDIITKLDHNLLNTWERHFQSCGEPYAITQQTRLDKTYRLVEKRLWKRRVV